MKYFSFLIIENQFEIVSSKFFGKISGNIVLHENGIFVRLWTERGKPFMDIGASIDGEWLNLPIVRKLLDNNAEVEYMDVNEQALFLRENLDQINKLFGEECRDESEKFLRHIEKNKLCYDTMMYSCQLALICNECPVSPDIAQRNS